MNNTDCGMNEGFLYGFRAGRKLADGEVERTVDHVFGWPFRRGVGALVEEGAHARREAEHWKDAGIGQPLAEVILREMLALHRPVNLWDEASRGECNDRRSLRLKLRRRTDQKQIAYFVDARMITRNPRCD